MCLLETLGWRCGWSVASIWDTDDKNTHGATPLRSMAAIAYEERVCSRHDARVDRNDDLLLFGQALRHRASTHQDTT